VFTEFKIEIDKGVEKILLDQLEKLVFFTLPYANSPQTFYVASTMHLIEVLLKNQNQNVVSFSFDTSCL